jgi:ABC-type polar amino acid transport system ATPase subunit
MRQDHIAQSDRWLLVPTEGYVWTVGMVFQDYSLFAWLTVLIERESRGQSRSRPRHGVSGLFAVSMADRSEEHRVRAWHCRHERVEAS